MPTEIQKDTVIFVCQLLSTLYQPIWLFRYNSRENYIFMIAGREEGLEITIFEDGNWEFNQDDEA
jgi:hypothetical protein